MVTEPFEVIALDIVGRLSLGKGIVSHILTAICMATRWPEVVPLKPVMAKAVAKAVIGIFGHTGLPLQII